MSQKNLEHPTIHMSGINALSSFWSLVNCYPERIADALFSWPLVDFHAIRVCDFLNPGPLCSEQAG